VVDPYSPSWKERCKITSPAGREKRRPLRNRALRHGRIE
jgi:hypothetical protein